MTGSSSSSDVTAVVDGSTVDGADGVWPEGSGVCKSDTGEWYHYYHTGDTYVHTRGSTSQNVEQHSGP